MSNKLNFKMVGTQLARWSLPIPEDPGSNPGIVHVFRITVEKTKIKKNRQGIAH